MILQELFQIFKSLECPKLFMSMWNIKKKQGQGASSNLTFAQM